MQGQDQNVSPLIHVPQPIIDEIFSYLDGDEPGLYVFTCDKTGQFLVPKNLMKKIVKHRARLCYKKMDSKFKTANFLGSEYRALSSLAAVVFLRRKLNESFNSFASKNKEILLGAANEYCDELENIFNNIKNVPHQLKNHPLAAFMLPNMYDSFEDPWIPFQPNESKLKKSGLIKAIMLLDKIAIFADIHERQKLNLAVNQNRTVHGLSHPVPIFERSASGWVNNELGCPGIFKKCVDYMYASLQSCYLVPRQ